MKRKLICLFLTVLLISALVVPASAAAGGGVTVKLPGFNVTLNCVTVDNSILEYPLLVYNDITYFPMTYNFSRFLGVETDWRGPDGGLWLEETGVTAAYNPALRGTKNAQSYTAEIPAFPVGVNGRLIDNANTRYPFFVFRDVTYCPLTWEYCVGDFDWSYSFDAKTGLVISSANLFVEQYALPEGMAALSSGDFAAAMTTEHIYYNDGAGRIMRCPLGGGAADSKVVYELPINFYRSYEGETYASPTLCTEGNTACLNYDASGGFMSSPVHVRFNVDGTYEEVKTDWSASFTYGETSVTIPDIRYGMGLLYVTRNGETAELAADGIMYGIYAGKYGAFSSCPSGCLLGSDFYCICAAATADGSYKNGLYRVNIYTGKTTLVVDRDIDCFTAQNGQLYYCAGDVFYYYSTAGQQEHRYTWAEVAGPVYAYYVLDGNIYWLGTDYKLYTFSEGVLEAAGIAGLTPQVSGVVGDEGENLLLTYEETCATKYRTVLLSPAGGVVFKTSDVSLHGVFVTNGRLTYINKASMTWCAVELG